MAAGQPTETQCFEHDNLRRLKAAWTPVSGDCSVAPSSSALGGPAPYWHAFEYDKTGNRMLEVRHATAASGTDTRREYTYPASGADAVRPHALRSVTSTGPGGTDLSAYTYDDAGNTLTRPGPNGTQSLSWDAEGRLGKVSDAEGETSYVYDANGDRLIRRDPNATTLYLDGAEITLDRATGEKSSTRHYEHLGKTIAVRTSKPGSTVGTVKFLLADHHGTAEVAVDSYTQELTRRRFDPFGNPRGEDVPWSGERGFVGGTLDASTGLTHLGAREYDPRVGRFISVDPIIDPGDPQQMHGYAYANNSPASFSDPDGLRFIGDNEGKVVATPQPSGGYSIYDERTGTRTGANASKKNLEKAEDRLNRARAEQERLKRKLINAGKLFLDILLEVTGAKAGIDCFLKGDVGGCIETAVTVISGLVGGLLVKIGAKYAFKWKAAARLAGKVAKLVTDIVDVVKNWGKAAKGVADATKNLAKARKAAKASKADDACSFTGDTKVRLANGKSKSLAKVKVGEKVHAVDPQNGEKGAREVTHVWVHVDTVVDLKVDDKKITTTEDHPFWNATDKQWQRADELDRGDKVATADGMLLMVGGIDWASARHAVAYNLTVADIHTYHAGEQALLVHNTCKIAPGGVKNLKDGAHMRTDDALDTATEFLGEGYRDMGGGRFLSRDGLRQVRMTDRDLAHPRQNPHINFETYARPIGPGVRGGSPVSNIHIYLPEEPGWLA